MISDSESHINMKIVVKYYMARYDNLNEFQNSFV